ncbi:hypothetical protein CO614_05620 [Lysobacteraceae bacterium NML120232]|nr:hypothetical protein CO614_05620 [Xanthomonadaceae bacterium NML120232]
MSRAIHIYCDESCHLENDGMQALVLGALWCPADKRKALSRKIKELKAAHGLPAAFEIKWVKVSPGKLPFYQALLDLFFDESELSFRGLVVPDKQKLDHARFRQSHDEFYYKQWYTLLNRLIDPENRYRIFLDIKDTQGQRKIAKLHDVLCNASYDFDRSIIESIEQVQSHDVPLLQLADLLIGVLAYVSRGLHGSPAKQALVAHVRHHSGLTLEQSSLLRARKFNLFVWRAQS